MCPRYKVLEACWKNWIYIFRQENVDITAGYGQVDLVAIWEKQLDTDSQGCLSLAVKLRGKSIFTGY